MDRSSAAIGLAVIVLAGGAGAAVTQLRDRQEHAPACPYIGATATTGEPLAGSEAAWARSSFGDELVDECWPGTP